MSSAAITQTTVAHSADTITALVDRCLEQTAEALLASHAASQTEVSHALGAARQSVAEGRPMDLIDATGRAQGHHEEQLGAIVVKLAEKVASTIYPAPPLIPFAGKLITPGAFYESFSQVHQMARALMAPVIYAEDTDSIGVASLNPIAAGMLAEFIAEAAHRRMGIRPFMTVVRMSYESWTFLCRKHFGL